MHKNCQPADSLSALSEAERLEWDRRDQARVSKDRQIEKLKAEIAARGNAPEKPVGYDRPEGGSLILGKAGAAVYGARQKDYGTPLDNHGTTAKLIETQIKTMMRRQALEAGESGCWSQEQIDAILQAIELFEYGPEDVCYSNILQKVSRELNGGGTEDTLIDIAGYAENVALCKFERKQRAGIE